MDIQEMNIRLEVLKIAKEIVEVNSLAAHGMGNQTRFAPSYDIQRVVLAARQIYEFITGDKTKEEAAG